MGKLAVLWFAFAAFAVGAWAGQGPPIAAKSAQVTLEYLGAAGWRITDGTTVILVDPYISRILGPPPPLAPPYARLPGDTRPLYGWNQVAVPDNAAVDARIPLADFVLVTHTHYDHVLDVPHIALKTHCTVIGTQSTENVLRAYGVPEQQLITVRGGEDYQFGSFSVKVIPSLHSPLDHKHYFSSDTAPAGMKAPLTLQQMHPEGGTLAYLVRFRSHQILVFGGMNYIEREMLGLEPDVVLVGAAASRNESYEYTARLMRALHFPALVLPTHWDNFFAPYEASQQASVDSVQSFVHEVRAASPKTKVIVPKYFEAISLEPAPK
jgi:L-ascorbate metabolism protein UlaG (beta-lactamase superfamily)